MKILVQSSRVLVIEENGSLTAAFSLDRERSLSVVYLAPSSSIPVGRTTVMADNRNEDNTTDVETVQLHVIEGDGTFPEGLKFAFTLMTVLELLAPWELDDLHLMCHPEADEAIGMSRAVIRTRAHLNAHHRAS